MTENTHEGGCVCGDVRYRTTADPDSGVVRHCEWCQRRTGSAFAVIPKFLKEDFEPFSGTLTKYREINEFGRRLDLEFCPRWRTDIGFTQKRGPWAQALDAGTFDRPGWLNAETRDFTHIFLRNHLDWSDVSEGHTRREDQMPD
ncbi:MAG: GFA family protein [Pseudomonadota bacterium]